MQLPAVDYIRGPEQLVHTEITVGVDSCNNIGSPHGTATPVFRLKASFWNGISGLAPTGFPLHPPQIAPLEGSNPF